MTCSPAGGLPLGFLICSSESEKVLTEAFEEFKKILPDDAFANRGRDKGPVLFMTDDADAEINALHKVWPEARLLLCVWHVLNAVWRWLWEGVHKINKADRPYLLKKFRSLLYAKTACDYNEIKTDLTSDELILQYPNFMNHLKKAYFERKDDWAICVRNYEKLPTHSTNTSNYVEASFRLTKDGQFNRTKAYNLSDLLDILLDDSVYYKKRLIDVGNGRFGAFRNTKTRYLSKKKINIRSDQIFDMGESNFIVESEASTDVFYNINMKSGYCECKAGANCGPCKHKRAISEHTGLAECNVLPEFDAKIRGLYHYIAQATTCKSSWYRDLKKPDSDDHVEEFVDERTDVSGTRKEALVNVAETETIEDGNQTASEDESVVDDEINEGEEIVLEDFVSAVDSFKSKVMNSFGNNLKMGVKFFTKQLKKINKGNLSNLKKSLYIIGKEVNNTKNKPFVRLGSCDDFTVL